MFVHRKRRAARKEDFLLSSSLEIISPVKMAELKLGDDSEYALMTDTTVYI